MSIALESRIRQFIHSSHQDVVAVGKLLTEGNWGQIGAVVERVSARPALASIASTVNASTTHLKEFIDRIQSSFEPQALKFVFGGVLAGVGGGMLAEAAGLALALGVSVFTVEIVAIALLLYGVSLALPAVWKLATEKFKQVDESIRWD